MDRHESYDDTSAPAVAIAAADIAVDFDADTKVADEPSATQQFSGDDKFKARAWIDAARSCGLVVLP